MAEILNKTITRNGKRTVDMLFQQFGVIDYKNGILPETGRPAARITFDRELSLENVKYIRGLKGVYHVGTCIYRYAPEIKKSYCVVTL